MAEIVDQLRLDIDQALRDVNRIEQAIDRALGSVELRLDPTQAQRQLDQLAQNADQALGDVDVDIDSSGAARLNSELAGVERNLAEADREAGQLEDAVRGVDRAADRANNTSKEMTGTFGTLEERARGIGKALLAIGGVAIFTGALRGANAAIQSFAQLEDSINAVNVVFGQGAKQVLAFGETAARSAGLSEAAFNQAVVPIGSLLQNFGFDAQEAASASVVLVQRAADLASVMGGSVQDALLAVGAALRGEADPLERYGASISAARVEQFALAQGLAATKAEITPAIILQARYGLILEDTAKSAGDFANTAGDLANAQRTASAAAANFATDIGEALAPALEVIVGLIPAVLEGLRQLVPSFIAAGDSAAAFLDSAAGGDDGFMREFFATLRAGAGDLGELIPGLGDLATVIGSSVATNVDAADRAIARLDTRLARSQLRRIGTEIARDLDSGINATEAFVTSVTQLGAESDVIDVFVQGFRDFAVQANLTAVEIEAATREILANAEANGLGADEIAALNDVLEILFNNTHVIGTEVNTATAAMAGFGESLPAAKFTEFSAAVEGGREVIRATLETLAADNEAQQERIAAALDPFAELPEQIELSAEEATAAIVAQFEAIAAFEANIARLAATAPQLAAELFAKGPAAADLVEDFLDTPALIEEAENALRGVPTAAVAALTEGLQDELEAAGLDPQTAARFAAIFSNPSIITAVTSAGLLPGEAGVQGFRQGILDEAAAIEVDARTAVSDHVSRIFAQEEVTGESGTTTARGFFDAIVDFDPLQQVEDFLQAQGIEIDLSGVGADSASSYIFGFQEEMASREDDLKEAVESATRGALQMESPSKLMMGLGGEAADSFALGFEQANLTLRLPTVPTGGLDTTGTMTGATGTAAGSGVNVTLITNNPTQQDEVSDVARMGQIASSIAASYRSVVPNGM